MPIQPLMQKLWQFTWDRNQNPNADRVELLNLHKVGAHYRFNRGEVGYAIQMLKQQNKLKYYSKSGWVAIR